MGAQRGWSTPCLLLLLSFHCQGRLYCSAAALFGKAGTLTFLVLIPFFIILFFFLSLPPFYEFSVSLVSKAPFCSVLTVRYEGVRWNQGDITRQCL